MMTATGSEHKGGMDIAIIGMTGRFPGARNIEEFWENLCNGVESVTTFSDAELLDAGVAPQALNDPNYVKTGTTVSGVELFDAAFFGFNPREAELTDPQQRLFLECAWEAFEHAGYDAEQYQGLVGVYAGTGPNTYLLFNLLPHRNLLDSVGFFQTDIGNDKDFLTTRVSYKLNLEGPSVSIQTACSTSLVAVHIACQSLLGGECDIALAGGVALWVPQKAGYRYQAGGILSPDGHCRAFDANAQGTIPGNGVGVVVLKRLGDAIADGDTIYAVIKGSAINNDGSLKIGYTAPRVDGQAKVIRTAHLIAGVEPETISYIEAHGTGTALGDPIEVAALSQVFRASTSRPGRCALGSVKTNIGHLDAAAGVAGLIKTTLALHHRQIPPSLHFQQPNPAIDFANSPFAVATHLTAWPAGPTPRRAGVSAFGIGGTNAHVVLEEAPPPHPSAPAPPWQLLTLSAKTSTALDAQTANLAAYLKQHPNINLADVAYTLQIGRRGFDHRRVIVARDVPDAIVALENHQPNCTFTAVESLRNRPVVLVCSGQGTALPASSAALYAHQPVFRQWVDHGCALLPPALGSALRAMLGASPPTAAAATSAPPPTALAQPALFLFGYALAQLWQAWGVRPQALLGHSLGEYLAACLAGVLSFADALALVVARGHLLAQLPPGQMLAVNLPPSALAPFLTPALSLAATNAPSQTVVAGPPAAITALAAQLVAARVACQPLASAHAFHSAMLDPLLPAFAAPLAACTWHAPQRPLLSGVTGDWLTASETGDPAYWQQQLRAPVQFSAAVARLLAAWPTAVLLEVGPGQGLTQLVRQQPAAQGRVVLPSLPRATPDAAAGWLASLGQLWLAGVPVAWAAGAAGNPRGRLPLPTYPFERQRFWIDPPRQLATSIAADQPLLATSTYIDVASEGQVHSATQHPRPDLKNDYVAPRNATEQTIATTWQEVLGVEHIGVYDDFFDLHGHSLLAAQVIGRLRDIFQIELPLTALFDTPTVAGIAQAIEEAQQQTSTDSMEILKLLAQLSEEEVMAEINRRSESVPI